MGECVRRFRGAAYTKDLIFDPLPDDAFGARVYLQVVEKFEMNELGA